MTSMTTCPKQRCGVAQHVTGSKAHRECGNATGSGAGIAARHSAAVNPVNVTLALGDDEPAPRTFIESAVDEGDIKKAVAAASYPETPPEELEAAAGVDVVEIRLAAVSNPNASEQMLIEAIHLDPSLAVRKAAAAHENAPAEVIDSALDNVLPEIRQAAASNPNATESHIDQALSDSDEAVRHAAVSNVALSSDLLDWATRHESPSIRQAAASNPKLSPQQYEQAMNDPEPQVRKAAVGNTRCPTRILDGALSDPDPEVRCHAATQSAFTYDRHSNRLPTNRAELGMTGDLIDKALSDPHWEVRAAAAANLAAPPESLERVFADTTEDPRVRAAAVANTWSTAAMRQASEQDPDPLLQEAAWQAYASEPF